MTAAQDQAKKERALKLSATALHFARRRDGDRATRAMQVIAIEFGLSGLYFAMAGWIDTMIAQRGMEQGAKDRITQLGVIDAGGTVVPDIGEMPSPNRWAAQLCAARMAMDEPAFMALIDAVPAEQFGEHINCLLGVVATNMNEYDKRAPLLNMLRAGLEWLYRTEQPDGVVMQHHGVTSPPVDNRWFGFTPTGANNLPVVSVNIADQIWADKGRDRVLTNGMRDNELGEIAQLVMLLGYQVRETWNGAAGAPTGSIGLARPAHPTLRAAVSNYQAGCPTHHTTLCSWDGCTWSVDNSKALIEPTWPQPAAPADASGDTTNG